MKLLSFIADLSRDPQLRKRYYQDPDSVMQETGLTEEQQKALLWADVKQLLVHIRREFLNPSVLQPCPFTSDFEILSVTPSIGVQGSAVQVGIVAERFRSGPHPQSAAPPPPGVGGYFKCWLMHENTGEIIPGMWLSGPDPLAGNQVQGSVEFTIPLNAVTGPYQLWIWAVGRSWSSDSAFTVLEASPRITGLREGEVRP